MGNRVTDVPVHAQIGPKPQYNPPGDTFTERLKTGLCDTKFLPYPTDNIVIAFYSGPGKFTQSEIDFALQTCKEKYQKLYQLATIAPEEKKNTWIRLCITVSTLLNYRSKPP